MVEAIGEDARRELGARATELDAGKLRSLSPLLLIVPHADDEVLGCGGLIAEACDLKLDVRVVYLTDGAASHLGSPTWPPDRLARVRRCEALGALDALGLGTEQVLFLDWPDASPHPPHSPAFARSVEAVLSWTSGSPPRSLWAPYGGEGHCDHQAAWALTCELRQGWEPEPTSFEYLVWGWNELDIRERLGGRKVWNLSCARHIPRRRHALACHATQLGNLIDDARESFSLPQSLIALVDCPSQIFVES